MSSHTENREIQSVSFDPFGEKAVVVRPAPRDGRSYRTGIIVFWAIALLLVGGRIYTSDLPIARTVVAALTGTIAQ
ncbi:hypothetical protein [Bradyrhizobium prioriisuperbiae]|uniref:hypothetical protein n=1 Tax=Bradyrhizobium prioriisuperbiae TaxID=2854389 RepID=UPI0028ED9261|nr:hypothetical protein [Bradyrhizobium prioritasuperba]